MSNVYSLPKKATPFSIVLVNYKSLDITKICLELLHEQLAGTDTQVYVVDNDSADASLEYLRSLNWINLIERPSPHPEPGHIAHGRALDLALAQVTTDHLFLLHTDTFVYDKAVFEMMMAEGTKRPGIVAVGCTEQLDRGTVRTAWRLSSRFCKHHYRRIKTSLGLRSKLPKPYRETHLKSFCTLWNAKLMKQHGLHFCMDDRVPGYTLQDRVIELGHDVVFLAPRKIFRYLDHIQAGTVVAAGGYAKGHRRTQMYADALARLRSGGLRQA